MNQIHSQWQESLWKKTEGTNIKQGNITKEQRTESKDKKTRIFKYPYLIERSGEKAKQDNKSHRSTEKSAPRTQHRRKIFEDKPLNILQLKRSTLSADRNRTKLNNFQFNPVKQKIKKSNSRQKLLNKNIQDPYAHLPIANPLPVIFNYSNPNSSNYAPSVSLIRKLPSQVPFSSQQNHHYVQTLNGSPIFHKNPQSLVYYHNPVVVQERKNQPPFSNQVSYIGNLPPEYPKYEGISRIGSNYERNESPTSLFQSNSSFKPLKAVISSHNKSPNVIKSMIQNPNLAKPINCITKQQISYESSIPNQIKFKKQQSRQSMTTPTASQNFMPSSMYETYKIGDKNSRNQNKYFPLTKRITDQHIDRIDNKNPSISSFGNDEVSCEQSSEIRPQEQEHGDLYNNPKYSDRFDDMDINDRREEKQKKKQDFHRLSASEDFKKIRTSFSGKSLEETKSKQLSHSETYQKQHRKQSVSRQQLQSQKKFLKYLHKFAEFSQEGRFINIFLIGLSILLVIFQIVR